MDRATHPERSPPLAGVRVLSLEQAAALPFATRHLADLGATVIRAQSHHRPGGGLADGDLTRNKLQVAIDLSLPGGPEAFRRLAAEVDVIAHNFTPRVVRKYGIDFDAIVRLNPDAVYVSVTGFGTTGPWSDRPLFGPGAEAVSGHNELIGAPDGWPGRPGTIVYADNTAGLNVSFAVLAALDARDRTGEPQFVDLSLYESAVSHLGPVLAEAQLGARPGRAGNADCSFALHGVFSAAGIDRHVALAVRADERATAAAVLGIDALNTDAVAAAVRARERDELVSALQRRGIAAVEVADAADLAASEALWSRQYFAMLRRERAPLSGEFMHAGPAWGHGSWVPLEEPRHVGEDTALVLREIGGLSEAEISELYASGAAGEAATHAFEARPLDAERRLGRGELSRAEEPGRWRATAERASGAVERS